MDFTKLVQEQPEGQLRKKHGPIEEGDLVIISERHDSFQPVYVKRGASFQNRFGNFHHDDIIGKKFGSKVGNRSMWMGGYCCMMIMMIIVIDDDALVLIIIP